MKRTTRRFEFILISVLTILFAAAVAHAAGESAESPGWEITAPPIAAPGAPPAPAAEPSVGSEAASATETAAVATATGTASATGAQNLSLKTGAVIRVATDPITIFDDQGLNNGVAAGMKMEVYRTEPVKGMKGEILEEDEIPVGWIKAVLVNPRVSVCEVLSQKREFKRGDIIRYYAEGVKPSKNDNAGRCPAGMSYDSGGAFVFVPGAIFASEPAREQVAETQPFCIDMKQPPDPDMWVNADDICKKRGKRLCGKQELQKVCAVWEKPKPCPRDLWKKNDCPKQDTVIDFYRNQEWTADFVTDADGNIQREANSCSCPATSPVCTHCVYSGCGVAKKPFRCCSDPIPEQKPEKK